MFDLLLFMLWPYGIYCHWPICLLLMFYCLSFLCHGYYVMASADRKELIYNEARSQRGSFTVITRSEN